jgi:histidinol-phosphate aminotransferase
MGLGLAGLSVAPLSTWASPLPLAPGPEADNQPGPIRLSSNENPYGPSSLAKAAISAAISGSNRYNWNTIGTLIAAIAQKNQVSEQNVLTGAGSTEMLDLTARYLCSSKGSFVVADPSFTGWTRTLEYTGNTKIVVPLRPDKKNDLPAMLAAIRPDTKFVYVCNPNNPTGTLLDRVTLISFIREATQKTSVIVDEAYIDFSGQQSVSILCKEIKNLIVVRTFSKIYGLAGLRIGYAIAHEETIEKMDHHKSWGNGDVSYLSRAAAIASLKDDEFVKACYLKNEEVKKYTIDQLAKLDIACIPSFTNFIYFSLANYKKDFFSLLKSNDIQGTEIFEEAGKWSRITVGTMAEMKRFLGAVR